MKKLISALLVLAMVFAMLPTLALIGSAEDEGPIVLPPDCFHNSLSYTDNGNGTHTVTCANPDCGAVITASEAHTFTNGTCVCGAEEPAAGPTVDPNLTLDVNYSALALEGATMLRMCVHKNYMTNYDDVFNTSYMEVVTTKYNKSTGEYYTETSTIYPQATLYSKNYYSYNIENIPAARLNDSMVMTIHAFDANGNEYVGSPLTYSAALRAHKYIEDNKPIAATAAALLRYAGAFQTYFNYNTENLASDLLTAADNTAYPYVAPTLPQDEPGTTALAGALITSSQKSLDINGTVGISMSWKGITNANASDYTMLVEWTTSSNQARSATISDWTYRNTTYGSKATFYSFAAAQMRTRASFTVYSGENAASATVEYSIADYVAYAHTAAAGGNAAAQALVQPFDYMLAYGDAATAYFYG